MDLVIIALAPVFLLLFYVYLRDKYDREPIGLLVKGLFAGAEVGYLRAFTAVPGHAAYGALMGYYFGRAKLEVNKRGRLLFLAFLIPFLFHGVYDFLLMANHTLFLILFIPFLYFLFRTALRRMTYLSEHSIMRPGAKMIPNNSDDGIIQHRDQGKAPQPGRSS